MGAMELSITDAAQALGISPNTVRRRLTNGLLTGSKVDGKWLIDVAETEGYYPMPLRLDPDASALVERLESRIAVQDAELSAQNVQINQLRGLLSQNTLSAVNMSPKRRWWQILG